MTNRMMGRLVAVAALSFLMLAGHADASVIISAPSISGAAGSTGTFDVILENTGPNAIDLFSFEFAIETTNPGISFASATTATILPYVFAGDSLFGPDITVSNGLLLIASDLVASAPFVSIASGASVGLGHVTYTIDANAAFGAFGLTFNGPLTALGDQNGPIVDFTTTNGEVTVTPEPGGMGLIGGLALVAFGMLRKRLRG